MGRAVDRPRVAWLLSLGLMAAGAVVAHLLAYRLVLPTGGGGHQAHAGHAAGTSHLELCLAVCGSVALVGLAAAFVSAARRGREFRMPLWIFALVPPVGFVVQDQLSSVLQPGAFSQAGVLEPVFLVGLLLQLPFAFLAFVAARALVEATVALVETLRAPWRPRIISLDSVFRTSPEPTRAFASILARGFGQRAPPALVA